MAARWLDGPVVASVIITSSWLRRSVALNSTISLVLADLSLLLLPGKNHSKRLPDLATFKDSTYGGRTYLAYIQHTRGCSPCRDYPQRKIQACGAAAFRESHPDG